MKDFNSNMVAAVAIAAAVHTATAGATVDLKGYNGVTFLTSVGVGGITFTGTNKITFVLEESDAAGSGFTAVETKHILGVPDTVADGEVMELVEAHSAAAVYKVGYTGDKRYVRLRAVFAGTHGTGTPISAIAALDAMIQPAADQLAS